jgi:hypothetical protein
MYETMYKEGFFFFFCGPRGIPLVRTRKKKKGKFLDIPRCIERKVSGIFVLFECLLLFSLSLSMRLAKSNLVATDLYVASSSLLMSSLE